MDGRLQNSRLMMAGVVLSWIMDFSGIPIIQSQQYNIVVYFYVSSARNAHEMHTRCASHLVGK